MHAPITVNCNSLYFRPRDQCPVCFFDNIEVLYSCPLSTNPVRGFIDSHYRHQGIVNWQFLEGTDYVLCDCRDCGLIFQRHVPNDFMLREIYDVMIKPAALHALETNRLTLSNFWQIGGELDVLFRMVRKHPVQIKFLDYGFGHGRWARVAAAMGAKVYATELSPEKIRFAETIGVEIIDDAEIGNLQFDIVHTEQVFEHLTEPEYVFRRLAGSLADGGIIKVAVPPQGDIRTLLRTHGMLDSSPLERLFMADAGEYNFDNGYICVAPLEHLNAYSEKSVAHLARSNNLKLVCRVRRETVSICTVSVNALIGSLQRLARVSLRPIFRRNSGYYIFARVDGSIS